MTEHIPLSEEQTEALNDLVTLDQRVKAVKAEYDRQLLQCIELGVPYVHMGEALGISDSGIRQYAKRRGYVE